MEAKKLEKVAVIGSGSWGTAVTGLLAPRVESICVWSHEAKVASAINECHRNPHQLTSFEIPACVHATTDMGQAVSACSCVLVVVPSAFVRGVVRDLASHLGGSVPVLVLTKGIERETGCLMAEVVEQEIGEGHPVAVLSGPNHAEEIAEGKVSAAVVASRDLGVAEFFQHLLESRRFRLYVTSDVAGVEVCAAAKNVIAIACGIAWATGAGDNALAALMTRGLAEVGRITRALGGDPLTCMGLAGMGDLIATCTSRHSRNRTFGEAFVAGESLNDYQERTGMVVEGAEAACSILQVAGRHNVQVPITRAVHDMLFCRMPIEDATDALLGRLAHDEFYDVRTLAGAGTEGNDRKETI